jgi:hypothetical protein
VLFVDNQVALRVREQDRILIIASVAIISLRRRWIPRRPVRRASRRRRRVTNALAFAISLRASDNRLNEGLPNAIYSGVTLGVMNMTTDNQATHCLLIRRWGGAGLIVAQPNTVLMTAIQPEFCITYAEVLCAFGTTISREV